MQPASSTVRRAPGVRAVAAILLPLALGVAACGSGGGHARAGAGGTTTTVGADPGGATTTTAGAETASTVRDTTTKWCTAFRSVDQDPASVDEVAMVSIVPPQDELEFPWIFVVHAHNDLHTPQQDSNLTEDYNQLKTYADANCPR